MLQIDCFNRVQTAYTFTYTSQFAFGHVKNGQPAMYVCMHVCMYVCIVCVYIYYTSPFTFRHVENAELALYVCMHADMYVCMYMDMCRDTV